MRTTLLIFLLICLCCCGRNNKNETDNEAAVIKIDLLSEPESTLKNLSEFASNVEYVPLQTTENSLLGEFVAKIVSRGNRIYIRNSGLASEIMCFDIEGKFLFKLDNKGRGPEEYTDIIDFDVSSDNRFLTILSTMNRKLVVYEISDIGFTFQKSFTIKDPVPWNIGLIPETNLAFLAVNPWNRTAPTLSLLINTNGDTIHFKPNSYGRRQDRESSARALGTTLVYSVDKTVCFREFYSDTVFFIDAIDNSFKPRIVLDTHGTLSTPEMVGHPERGGDQTTMIDGIYETSRYVFINFRDGPSSFHCILFDRTTKAKYKLNIGTITETIANIPRNTYKILLKDDLRGGPDFNQEILGINSQNSGGKLFSYVNAITLKKYIAGEEFKNSKVSNSKKTELKKLADSLKETDNPVLIIVTPKN